MQLFCIFFAKCLESKKIRFTIASLNRDKMNTQILLTDEELAALMVTSYKNLVEKSIKDDPNWSHDGCGGLNVVYCNCKISPTQLVIIGMAIQLELNEL